MSTAEMTNIECNCRFVSIEQKLQTAFLFASFAFWSVFVTRPFRPGPSPLSRSAWLIIAFLDTFLLVTSNVESPRIQGQMIGVGVILGLSSAITFIVELGSEGDRQQAENDATNEETQTDKSANYPAEGSPHLGHVARESED